VVLGPDALASYPVVTGPERLALSASTRPESFAAYSLSFGACPTRKVATARARRMRSKKRKETSLLDGKEERLLIFSFLVCSLRYGLSMCILLYRFSKW